MEISAYGIWEVTTEGDVEGKSTTRLGTHEGFIDEIALALADKCYYALNFKQVSTTALAKIPKKVTVNIALDISTGTWSMSASARVEYVKELLKGRPVFVRESNYYAAVEISTTQYNEEDIAKQRALAKLTDKEKKLLNLK